MGVPQTLVRTKACAVNDFSFCQILHWVKILKSLGPLIIANVHDMCIIVGFSMT
jgi:hypothetical protein